jgi:GT2 family glycosyltransferase
MTVSPGNKILLSVSIVTFHPDPDQFRQMIASLDRALSTCNEKIPEFRAVVTVVDNGNELDKLRQLLDEKGSAFNISIVSNPVNCGFGRAHNQVLLHAESEFHLVLNPDVILYSDSLYAAISHMQSAPQCVALAPEVRGESGSYQFLCKQYPSVIDLALRGFAPRFLKNRAGSRLAKYENQAMVRGRKNAMVNIISGCFMFCRTQALQKVGGFNPAFFLYFEDFALSLELGKLGRLEYVPAARIVHYGGEAGRKGLRHISYFARSAIRFYSLYGWKWL